MMESESPSVPHMVSSNVLHFALIINAKLNVIERVVDLLSDV